jgi:predicted phosphodiesterase
MRIGIVADTHMPRSAKKLPDALVKGLQGVESILHLGDWTSLNVAEWVSSMPGTIFTPTNLKNFMSFFALFLRTSPGRI